MSSNSIVLCMKFYSRQRGITSLWKMLVITGVSGILETLPILFALPLIRAIYLDTELVKVVSVGVSFPMYTGLLITLLVLRFLIGGWSQFKNAESRIKLLAKVEALDKNVITKPERVSLNKSIQSINYLFNAWSQFIPGVLFTVCGIFFSPSFGLSAVGIIIPWIFVIRKIKKIQDEKHSRVPTNGSEEFKSNPGLWLETRIPAAKWDAVSKNLREFVVISTLVLALYINHVLLPNTPTASLIIIIMYLRGLQQLYTGFIMSQQIAANREFLNSNQNLSL